MSDKCATCGVAIEQDWRGEWGHLVGINDEMPNHAAKPLPDGNARLFAEQTQRIAELEAQLTEVTTDRDEKRSTYIKDVAGLMGENSSLLKQLAASSAAREKAEGERDAARPVIKAVSCFLNPRAGGDYSKIKLSTLLTDITEGIVSEGEEMERIANERSTARVALALALQRAEAAEKERDEVLAREAEWDSRHHDQHAALCELQAVIAHTLPISTEGNNSAFAKRVEAYLTSLTTRLASARAVLHGGIDAQPHAFDCNLDMFADLISEGQFEFISPRTVAAILRQYAKDIRTAIAVMEVSDEQVTSKDANQAGARQGE